MTGKEAQDASFERTCGSGKAQTSEGHVWASTEGSFYRKKAVPLPRSLPELQQTAVLNLYPGRDVRRMRMFHKGREIHLTAPIPDIVDGDVIHCRRAMNTGEKEVDDPIQSTHQADLINFGVVEPAKPMIKDGTSVLSAVSAGKTMEGRSRYMDDYTKHPVSARQSCAARHQTSNISQFKTDGALEKSSYKSQFVWHEAAAEQKSLASRGSDLSGEFLGKKFEAVSNYKDDYFRSKGFKQPQPDRVTICDNDSTLTDAVRSVPFSGMSTYGGHYVKFMDAEKRQPVRPQAQISKAQPLEPHTEYRRQYQGGANTPRAPFCHVEAVD